MFRSAIDAMHSLVPDFLLKRGHSLFAFFTMIYVLE
jgi:hypothetical protein